MDYICEFQGEYRWLSNFWSAPVSMDGDLYPTVEHAYQAAKTHYPAGRARVRAASTPGQAKKLGRGLAIRPDWESVKLRVMENLLFAKFQSHPVLAEKLLATGAAKLYEGNRWGDLYWGVDLETGEGANHLGRLLMKVREELRRAKEN